MNREIFSFNRSLRTLATALTLLVVAAVFVGCGSSVDQTFVNQAGMHGNALEAVVALYNQNVLEKTSNRDLDAINEALEENDLSAASVGDVTSAQKEIQSRLRELTRYQSRLAKANRKLKTTPVPDFDAGLDASAANEQFAKDYQQTTDTIERYANRGLGAVKLGVSALKKYLTFLERWERFLRSDDTGGLVAAGEASDKALSRLNKAATSVDRGGTLPDKLQPLVDSMARSANQSDQLESLVSDLKDQYPKSFLAVHLVEQ